MQLAPAHHSGSALVQPLELLEVGLVFVFRRAGAQQVAAAVAESPSSALAPVPARAAVAEVAEPGVVPELAAPELAGPELARPSVSHLHQLVVAQHSKLAKQLHPELAASASLVAAEGSADSSSPYPASPLLGFPLASL